MVPPIMCCRDKTDKTRCRSVCRIGFKGSNIYCVHASAYLITTSRADVELSVCGEPDRPVNGMTHSRASYWRAGREGHRRVETFGCPVNEWARQLDLYSAKVGGWSDWSRFAGMTYDVLTPTQVTTRYLYMSSSVGTGAVSRQGACSLGESSFSV